MRVLPHGFLLALLAGPLSAPGQQHIVSQDPCAVGAFAQIQDAIDAASDGDTILVDQLAGFAAYAGIVIDGKDLTITAKYPESPPFLRPVVDSLEIRNVDHARTVAIEEGMPVTDCPVRDRDVRAELRWFGWRRRPVRRGFEGHRGTGRFGTASEFVIHVPAPGPGGGGCASRASRSTSRPISATAWTSARRNRS